MFRFMFRQAALRAACLNMKPVIAEIAIGLLDQATIAAVGEMARCPPVYAHVDRLAAIGQAGNNAKVACRAGNIGGPRASGDHRAGDMIEKLDDLNAVQAGSALALYPHRLGSVRMP